MEFARTNFINPGIEEVDYNRINEIILKTKSFIEDSYLSKELELNVFDEDTVKDFIHLVAKNFLNEYGEFIKPYLSTRQITLKKEN